jgi:hypothetical protein
MSGEEAPLEKFEQISNVVRSALPGNMTAQVSFSSSYFSSLALTLSKAYYGNVVPQLLTILLANTSAFNHQRAAGFALSHLISEPAKLSEPSSVAPADIALPLIHQALVVKPVGRVEEATKGNYYMTPSETLSVLIKLLRNTDPSPTLISDLLSPIAPSLYSIYEELERIKTADPEVKESVQNLLLTWGKLVGNTSGVVTLWRILNGEGGYWSVDIAGEIVQTNG